MSDRRRRFSKSRSRANRYSRSNKNKDKEEEKSREKERSREKEIKEKSKEEIIQIKSDSNEIKEEIKPKSKTKEKDKILNNILLPSQTNISFPKETKDISNQYPTIKVDKIKLLKLLKCPLCKGFYRTPYTINECMHTFCRSCIVKYFSSSVQREACPFCETKIGGRPMDSLIFDNYLDSLLNILFPKFEEIDKKNINKLYKTFRDIGNPLPGDIEEAKLKMPTVKIYIMNENSKDNKITGVFLVPKNFNVDTLKKLIKQKIEKEIDNELIEIKYKDNKLDKDMTMEVIDARFGFDQDKNIFYYNFKKK